MYKLLFAVAFMLSSCATPVSTLHKEHNYSGVTITWVRDTKISSTIGDLNTCTIHAPEPEDAGDYERIAALAYAAMHCFYGGFNNPPAIIGNHATSNLRRNMNRETMYVDWIRTKPSHQAGVLAGLPPSVGIGAIPSDMQYLGNAVMTGIDSCEIYVMEPHSEDDRKQLEKIGHEILHCYFWQFHN